VVAVVLLGERPTRPDIVGFALILGASGCVLLAPGAPARVTEPT
jgi:drug/metabolite transporter (DMT)-like permease